MPEISGESPSKAEREQAAGEDPRLLTHRFVLSADPVQREMLSKTRDVFRVLQQSYPEAVALNFFGSHTKGYAGPDSDLDLFLILDYSKAPHRVMEAMENTPTAPDALKTALAAAFGIPEERIDVQYHIANELSIRNEYAARTLRALPFFLLSADDGIRPYRDTIISLIENDPNGERVWSGLMLALADIESRGLPENVARKREQLYPFALTDARAYFLRGNPDAA